MSEVGQWLRQFEGVDIWRTNEEFVDYLGLSLEEHTNTAKIFDATRDSNDDDENLDYFQMKIYFQFGMWILGRHS